MVLLRRRGLTRGEVAAQCGVSLQSVDRWVARFAENGAAGLASRSRARTQVSEHARTHALKLAAALLDGGPLASFVGCLQVERCR